MTAVALAAALPVPTEPARIEPAPAATELNRRAAQCRRLANSALPYDLVLELEKLADDYDRRVRPVAPTGAAATPLSAFFWRLAQRLRGN